MDIDGLTYSLDLPWVLCFSENWQEWMEIHVSVPVIHGSMNTKLHIKYVA